MKWHVAVFVLALFNLWAPTTLRAQAESTQNSAVLNYEGVAGSIDKKHRNPALSVGLHKDTIPGTPGQVRILVDANVENSSYSKFPIRFDFYINRELVSSQMRSEGLPGGIGFTAPLSKYPMPFSYQVIATLIFQNGSHSTMIEGAATEESFGTESAGTLDCTLVAPKTTSATPTPSPSPSASPVETDDSSDSSTYVANGVGASSTTADPNTYPLSFSAKSAESGETVNLSGSVQVTEGEGTVDLTITAADGSSTTTRLTGTVVSNNNSLSSAELSSEDALTTLSCS